MKIRFISIATVLDLHDDQVRTYGGDSGTRDKNLLESAVAMPRSTFGGVFLHPTVPEMAAAYLFHIVKNHPFVDGNKRTGTATALAFLDANGFDLDVTQDELTAFVTDIAAGNLDKAQATEFFKANVRPK
jgi:death-on-curing protein